MSDDDTIYTRADRLAAFIVDLWAGPTSPPSALIGLNARLDTMQDQPPGPKWQQRLMVALRRKVTERLAKENQGA